ncbi:MAG: tetratricopeptide repeat protein [Planctomycetota bacterium]|nr:tetratricopeptide repeat protein [Planctomycetota bacterium]
MKIKRAILYVAVTLAVLAAGCGKLQMDKNREEARQRWSVSRAEMVTRMADAQFQRGEVGRARQSIDDLLRATVPYSPLYVLAARMEADKGDLDAARSFADHAVALDPQSAEARYVLGTVEQTLGHSDRALYVFSEAVRLDPNQSRYALALAEMQVAEGQPEEAVKGLREAAERMSGRAEVHAALGDVLALQKRYGAAAGSFRIALRLEPQRTDIKERLARALYASGEYAEAELMLADLAQVQPDFASGWIHTMRADCMLATGRVAQAREIYLAQAQNKKTAAAPLVGLAKCDILDSRLPAARKQLEEALARQPQHAEANALMGYILLTEGRRGEATAHLDMALKDPAVAGRETVERLLANARGDE